LDGQVPVGGIIMWSGLISAIAAIPNGTWALCDGAGGLTPNLTDRFVVGAGALFAVAETSAGTYLPDKTLVTSSGGAGTGSGTFTLAPHTIVEDNIPNHYHNLFESGIETTARVNPNSTDTVFAVLNIPGEVGGYEMDYAMTKGTGAEPTSGKTSSYGAASSTAPLTHEPTDIEVTGVAHDHTYGVPYLALAYIQRIA
jgi:microcystin-dependent protein